MPKSGSEYTPTTAQLRDAYVRAMRNAFIASADEHREKFDRWLKQEHKNAAADDNQAWLEAAHALSTIRAEYLRFLENHDTFELARAVGQILGEHVSVLPIEQWKTVKRPDDANG